MATLHLIGFCMGCHYAHTLGETTKKDGVFYCREMGSLVEPFANPIPLAPAPIATPQTTLEAVRTAILDMAFHAGIDTRKNKAALEEIAQKFCALIESEQ